MQSSPSSTIHTTDGNTFFLFSRQRSTRKLLNLRQESEHPAAHPLRRQPLATRLLPAKAKGARPSQSFDNVLPSSLGPVLLPLGASPYQRPERKRRGITRGCVCDRLRFGSACARAALRSPPRVPERPGAAAPFSIAILFFLPLSGTQPCAKHFSPDTFHLPVRHLLE